MLHMPRKMVFWLAFIGLNIPKFAEWRALAMVACAALFWLCIGTLIERNRKVAR